MSARGQSVSSFSQSSIEANPARFRVVNPLRKSYSVEKLFFGYYSSIITLQASDKNYVTTSGNAMQLRRSAVRILLESCVQVQVSAAVITELSTSARLLPAARSATGQRRVPATRACLR